MTQIHVIEPMGMVHGPEQAQVHKSLPGNSINGEVLFICGGWKFLTPEGLERILPKDRSLLNS